MVRIFICHKPRRKYLCLDRRFAGKTPHALGETVDDLLLRLVQRDKLKAFGNPTTGERFGSQAFVSGKFLKVLSVVSRKRYLRLGSQPAHCNVIYAAMIHLFRKAVYPS